MQKSLMKKTHLRRIPLTKRQGIEAFVMCWKRMMKLRCLGKMGDITIRIRVNEREESGNSITGHEKVCESYDET